MAITLHPGREKSLLRHYPWFFASAIKSMDEKNPGPGQAIDVLSSAGQFLARASYSPKSKIRVRVWTFADEPVDREFFRKRIQTALILRDTAQQADNTDSYRLLHGDSDGLPGFIVDRYKDVLVLQSTSAGAEVWKETLADLLIEKTGIQHIYERSDADVRALEGLPPITGILRGRPDTRVLITEYGIGFLVDIAAGHKTGFYLDQRENRHRPGEFAHGRDVLNCFCYSGRFSMHALAGGAKPVISIDSSAAALALARENMQTNQLQSSRAEWMEGDVFQLLRKFRDETTASTWSFSIRLGLRPPPDIPKKRHVLTRTSTCWLSQAAAS